MVAAATEPYGVTVTSLRPCRSWCEACITVHPAQLRVASIIDTGDGIRVHDVFACFPTGMYRAILGAKMNTNTVWISVDVMDDETIDNPFGECYSCGLVSDWLTNCANCGDALTFGPLVE